MKRLLWSKWSFLLFIGLVIFSVLFIRSHQKITSENIGTVKREDLIQRSTIAGLVIPSHKTIISAPYNGYVHKLYVQIGQKVKTGDPIISVTQTVRGADEEVYPLRAPFPGTVVQVLRNEGEYVEQQVSQEGSNGLVRIDDLSHFYIDAIAPEIEVQKLKIGQEALIKALAILDHPYHGKIEHIALAAKEQASWDRSRVEFPVRIRVLDSDSQFMSGMSVIADVITQKLKNVLTLRHEFVSKENNQYFVTTAEGIKKEIEVGAQNEEVFEIRKGLREGDSVRQVDFLSLLKEP